METLFFLHLVLSTNLDLFVLPGTRHSNGWSTWPPRTTWRSRPTRPSWATWSPWGSHGSIQPRALQPGTSRTPVSRVGVCIWNNIWKQMFSYGTLMVCFFLLLFFFITVVHLRLTSLRDGAMVTRTGNRDSLIRVSPCFWLD